MINLSRSLIFLSLIVLILAPSTRAAEPAVPEVFRNLQAGKKQTVIVYGTSLTAGGPWTVALKEWLDEKYPHLVTFINSGGSGMNSDWGVENLKKKVIEHHPDLVFIEFSFNDAHEKFKMPVERGAANLEKIVKGIQDENPHATIVLQVMNVPWDTPNGRGSATSRPQLEAFNNNYRSYAHEHDLPLLDHYIAWQHLKETDVEKFHRVVPDGTHPNKEGSLEITWPTIKAWLEKSQAEAASPAK